MTRDRNKPIKVWVDLPERAEIARRAKSARLSLSAFARTAALNQPVRSVFDIEAVRELSKINGELGKNADLLKRLLDESGSFSQPLEIKRMIERFHELQKMSHELMGRMLR